MKMSNLPNPLNGMPVDTFLTEYWQKKPLLIRNAFANTTSPINANELAGLACEETVESRIIIQREGGKKWEIKHGPFNEKIFATLPKTHWTLLVQAVDHWVPKAAELLNQFNFIPRWRIDDLMVSYACGGGGVGPHFDNYDVFLLQSSGKRKWEIGGIYDETAPMRKNVPVAILSEFKAIESWELEAGDMLYVPPGFAHHGIAVGDDCITCSVGFRAPSHNEILREFTDYIGENLSEALRYTDEDLVEQNNTGEISAETLEKIAKILRKYCDDKKLISEWFGRYITIPKYPQNHDAETQNTVKNLTTDDLVRHFAEGGSLFRNESSRFAFEKTDNKITFFVDGDQLKNIDDSKDLIEIICAKHVLNSEDFIQSENLLKLLLTLLQKGSLYIPEA